MNNPSGTNSFTGFQSEPAYGEATRQKALASGAPMAGGKVAAGQLNAARKAGRQAQNPKPPGLPPTLPPAPPPSGIIGPVPPEFPLPPWTGPYPPGTIQNTRALWAQIIRTPGAERYPVLAVMARRAGAL